MADLDRGVIKQGADDLSIDLTPQKIDALLAYRDLLVQWNAAFNLTAIRDPGEMIVRHLLDSLAIAPHLRGRRFIDVGTGAGLPGVPLAIVYPNQQWTLLDSNGKKMRFLFQVKTQLNLVNTELLTERVEHCSPRHLFDGVVSRAFADLNQMCSLCHHLLARCGVFYAMKSQSVDRELSALNDPFRLRDNIALTVPGLEEARWLTVIHPTNSETSA